MTQRLTLLEMLNDLRAEIRSSLNPAHNTSARDLHINLLKRVQRVLWDEHDWAHLRVRREIALQAGQRYYDAPEDLPIDRIESVEVRWGGDWKFLTNGISNTNYSLFDSDLDERSWPVENWQLYEDDQFEVWPVPSDNATTSDKEGTLRLTGIRSLRPLVADNDRSDLDGRMIVLFAAAEELAARGAADAQLKLQTATRRRNDLIANSSKIKRVKAFGVGSSRANYTPRGPLRVHYRDRETS